jgi:hypothetical protein
LPGPGTFYRCPKKKFTYTNWFGKLVGIRTIITGRQRGPAGDTRQEGREYAASFPARRGTSNTTEIDCNRATVSRPLAKSASGTFTNLSADLRVIHLEYRSLDLDLNGFCAAFDLRSRGDGFVSGGQQIVSICLEMKRDKN